MFAGSLEGDASGGGVCSIPETSEQVQTAFAQVNHTDFQLKSPLPLPVTPTTLRPNLHALTLLLIVHVTG